MIALDRARELLGEAGRRLSDEEIRRRNDEARAFAHVIYDLLVRERGERQPKRATAA